MSDAHDKRGPGHGHDEQFDSEIDIRRIAWFLVWLAIGSIVTCGLMYALYRDFQHREERADTPPSPLVDRSQPRLAPEPRLQVTAEKDLARYRAEQKQLLESYGWVDQPLGVVHIPIDRAIDLVAAQQLPWRAAASPARLLPGGIPAASGVAGPEAMPGASGTSGETPGTTPAETPAPGSAAPGAPKHGAAATRGGHR